MTKPGNRFIFTHHCKGLFAEVHGEQIAKGIKKMSDRDKINANIKRSESGKLAQNRPEVKENASRIQKEAQNRPEVQKKRSLSHKKNWEDASFREDIMEKRKNSGGYEKASKTKIEKWKDLEYRERYMACWLDPERKEEIITKRRNSGICESLSKSMIEKWRDPEFVLSQCTGRSLRPNKPEIVLLSLLKQLYPGEYKYTGDFSFMIGGKNPDFVNINGQKKCIELFGDYWHKGQDPKDREKIFAEYGWDTLVIWEHELRDIERVKFSIHRFHRKGIYVGSRKGEKIVINRDPGS
uniref:Uncharacterized protein n=1 Tax=viral metagenome TaxID=1070528 RepID=A0A6M3M3M8_9ZZZZ